MATWRDWDWTKKLFKEAEAKANPKPARPIKEEKEEAVTRDLDKKAREDSVTPGLAVQERREGVVKVSSYEFYEKVAESLCALKAKKKGLAGKLSQFKK